VPASRPSPVLPPVPAEELSFWDLFPEDLPPVRPNYPTEDLLADHLALPDGPDSVAARVIRGPAREPAPAPAPPAAPASTGRVDRPAPIDPLAQMEAAPPPARPPHPADAEIVIAELLDGPVPTGSPNRDESIWAPSPPDDEVLVDDLLRGHDPAPARPGAQAPPPPGGRQNSPEQNRIAADQARRRRARRGDAGRRGGRPGGG
jgi:hypothetical protein